MNHKDKTKYYQEGMLMAFATKRHPSSIFLFRILAAFNVAAFQRKKS